MYGKVASGIPLASEVATRALEAEKARAAELVTALLTACTERDDLQRALDAERARPSARVPSVPHPATPHAQLETALAERLAEAGAPGSHASVVGAAITDLIDGTGPVSATRRTHPELPDTPPRAGEM